MNEQVESLSISETGHSLPAAPRALLAISAVFFGLTGLVLFLAPAWSAANFPWRISPLVAMTMGGWYLGSAAMAGLVVYRRRWNLIYASALYVGLFSLTETIVLTVHQSKVRLDAWLTWPYIGMLATALLASLVVVLAWSRRRIRVVEEGPRAPACVRVVAWFFVFFVLLLASVAFSGHWVGLNGGIFPEPLTPFTLHSFGAFYFSLAISVLPFLRVQRLAALTVHVWGGLVLILLISAAALVHLQIFQFGTRPFQAIYLGVYLAALVAATSYLWSQRAVTPNTQFTSIKE